MMNSVVKVPAFETRAFPESEEQRNNYLEEMENILKKAKTEQRSLSIAENNRFRELKSKIGEIDRNIEQRDLENLASNSVVTKKGKEKVLSAKEKEEIRAFIDYVRTGEMRDLSSGQNGAVIPTTIGKRIVDRVFEISPLIENATIYNVGEDLNLPVFSNDLVTTFITEFEEILTSGGTFASVPLKSKIIGTLTKLGKSLVNRTDLDVLPFIINAVAKNVTQFLENEIITNANNTFASTLANGVTQTVTAGTAGAIAPGDLVTLKNSIPSIMLPDAKWLMHKDTLSYIQSLTDANGNLLFGNNLSEIAGNTLLGYEVMLSDAMPVMGAGNRQIYFGNFEEGLAIKLGAQSIEVFKELFANQYALGVGSFMECDTSASHNAQAISVMIGA
jgi:HK97 family phage major capsid protein